MATSHHAARVVSTNISCKNNCGFYGNPSWSNYCSVCYHKEYLHKTPAPPFSQMSSKAFSKFEEKRKKVAGKSSATVRNMLKMSRDGRPTNSQVNEDSEGARAEFMEVLKGWKTVANGDVSNQVSKFLFLLDALKCNQIETLSMHVQQFYNDFSDRVYANSVYTDAPPHKKESLLNSTERFITIWIYPWTFAPRSTDDEQADLRLQNKIRSLQWVTHGMLEAPINPDVPAVSEKLYNAILSLNEINAVFATQDKLMKVVCCCRSVFEAINLSASASVNRDSTASGAPLQPANADDFLPSLIWVVMQANAPLLHSNLQFIIRFAKQSRLNTGEAAYFFTNLCCAIHFISDMTHNSLSMSEEEFKVRMGGGRTGIFGNSIFSKTEERITNLQEQVDSLKSSISSTGLKMDGLHKTQLVRLSLLRERLPLKRTVVLDPRVLEMPNVLILGPQQVSAATPVAIANYVDSTTVDPNLPSPIMPMPTTQRKM